MYLYFNENGILKEIINDKALRKGNANANVIYAYFQGDPEITTLTFNITPNGYQEAIILNQDDDSPIVANENNPECFVPNDSERKLKYFKYFTPYKFYKCTLTAETLASSGLWLMTLLAINSDQEQVAQGTYVGMVEDNNLAVDSTITYSQYSFLLGLVGSKINRQELDQYQEKLIAGTHISINENNVIDIKDIESTIDSVDLTDSPLINPVYKRITQEQIDLLKHNVLNFIVYQGLMYLPISGDKLKYSYVDYSIVRTIVIDEENLRWAFQGVANLSDIATHTSQINSLIPTVNALNVYNHIDISSHLDLSYIQTANQADTRAYMIETPHQIIFDIHKYGQSSSVPNGIITYDILKENIGNRLPRLYSSNIVAYGEYNYRFGSSYKKGMAYVQYSISNQSFGIQVINNGEETSLERKTLEIDIKITINLLN